MDALWIQKWMGKIFSSSPRGAKPSASGSGSKNPLFPAGNGAEDEAVPTDSEVASCRLAADHGDALAQLQLGLILARGQGAIKDVASAMCWFEKAAKQGNPGAQFQLAMQHQRASYRGAPQDASESKLRAYQWYYLAAAQGYPNSSDCLATLSISMSFAEVTEGNRRALAFAPETRPKAAARA